uniref:Zinc finger RING-type eukaryotic domain-containing protein n=1 Tax=Oryzias sinensis TaxID=183150 RepID=A0A8C7XYF2_9TELE
MLGCEQNRPQAEPAPGPGPEQRGAPPNPRAVCPACRRLFRDPRILPCLHSFCSDCIAGLEPFSVTRPDPTADRVTEGCSNPKQASHCRLSLVFRNHLHLQRAQLQQALADVRGAVEFSERLLGCGSDAEILSAKGVTLRRLSSLADRSHNGLPAAVAPDDGSSICFLPREPAGEVEGYAVVGVVSAKTVDVSSCTVEGTGLWQAREGEQGSFTLVCRDSAGEQMARGGEHVVISIVHKEKKGCSVAATVTDNKDGTYRVSFRPEKAGAYSVWVCVKAQHVKGSPFVLDVKRRFRQHSGTFHCCSFCSSGGAKEARCGCPGSMPGGFKGCGHSHKGHPGKPHWSCCGSTVEKSECLPQCVLDAVSPGGHLQTAEL